MSDLSSLIARLDKAEGPDRELDCQIAVAVDGFYELPPKWEGGPVGYGYTDAEGTPIHPGHGGDQLVRRYTSSIDAAVSLAESVVAKEGRKLICFFCAGGQLTPYNAEEGYPDFHPKAKIDNSVTVGWMSHVAFYNEDGTSEGDPSYSHGRTAALAICLSTLRALDQKGTAK